jgi:hypothetical protein
MIRTFRTLCVATLLAGSVSFAHAGKPALAPAAPAPLANAIQQAQAPIVLQGREDLPAFGALAFVVQPGGIATMMDSGGTPVRGTVSVNGNHVRFQFADCVYDGFAADNVLAGTARFTNGPNAGQTWNFRVDSK